MAWTVIKQKLKHASYKECLMKKLTREDMVRIQTNHCNLYAIRQRKIILSPFDDKIYILPDGANIYAYGHFRIQEEV